jgi:hypothetical protein
VKADFTAGKRFAKSGAVAAKQFSAAKHALADMLIRQQRDDLRGILERRVPLMGQLCRVRSRPVECKRGDLGRRIARRPSGFLKNRIGSESRIFPRCRPGQVSERLYRRVALQDIDPIARLDAADEREDLVRGKVERVQRETELRMFDERKETERAVVRPLQDDGLRPAPYDRFDERRPFANDLDLVPGIEQRRTVGISRSGATGNITLARRNPLPRYEAADLSLDVRESHSSIFPAR